ncbi:hypothetical protein AQ776_04050 [Burkholderia pseudomallei]|nr:hypothetical protein AQ776_04050 [Burkholderia pseudomallei]
MRGLSRATRAVRRVCFRDDAVACDSTRSEASRCAAHPRPRKIFNAWQILTAAARRAKANGCKRGSRAAASRSHSREPGATAPRCGISCPRKIFNAWQILTAAAWRTKANGCKRRY